MENDLVRLRGQIGLLESTSPVDHILETLQQLEFFEQLIRELRSELEPRLIDWISHHGAIECGDIRYYVGNKKITKCRDKKHAVDTILTATGGDLDCFCNALVSQPFKYGLARTILAPEDYGRCFISVEEPELREGKPVPTLLRIDTQFLR